YEIARKLPEGSEVSLESSPDDAKLTLVAGRAKFDLPCLPATDFPALSAEGLTHSFELGPKELSRLIDKTRFAISTEETRYYLHGVHLHAKKTGAGGMLRAVATDGHRLALVENELPSGAEGMPAVIVPRKTVAELRRLLDDVDVQVQVAVSDAKIRFDL